MVMDRNGYYSAFKKREIVPHVTVWINLEDITLVKQASHRRKNIVYSTDLRLKGFRTHYPKVWHVGILGNFQLKELSYSSTSAYSSSNLP